MAVRANLRLALAKGRFDVVHGFEPGLPSLSYLALTLDACAHRRDVLLRGPAHVSRETLATRPAPNPGRRAPRDVRETAEAAADRFDGEYGIVPIGVDLATFKPATKRDVIAVELEAAGRATTRALLRLLRELPDWEATLLHTKPLGVRPAIPRSVRERVHVRSARTSAQRADALAPAAIFVSAPGGEERLALEAAACEAARVSGSSDRCRCRCRAARP